MRRVIAFKLLLNEHLLEYTHLYHIVHNSDVYLF